MEAETKANLSDRTIWVRILYMVLFVIAFSIAEFLVAVVAIFQAIVVLITGSVNAALHRFGKNLSAYIGAILEFETFNSEALPFPFSDWPDLEPTDTHWSADQAQPAATGSEPYTDASATKLDADMATDAQPAGESTDQAQAELDEPPADEPPRS